MARNSTRPASTSNRPLSRARRSGVCVVRPALLYLVISREEVTFYSLATFFRDGLRCRDGLYLDGAISEMRAPSLGRTTFAHDHFAGMLAVVPAP